MKCTRIFSPLQSTRDGRLTPQSIMFLIKQRKIFSAFGARHICPLNSLAWQTFLSPVASRTNALLFTNTGKFRVLARPLSNFLLFYNKGGESLKQGSLIKNFSGVRSILLHRPLSCCTFAQRQLSEPRAHSV